MTVLLTEDQRALVQDAIAAGRLSNEEEAVRAAMLLWEERERRRAEILAALDAAESSLARGEGRTIADPGGFAQLSADIKRRGRERLDGERPDR